MEEDKLVKERSQKIVHYLKRNYNLVSYVFLAFIVFLAVKIRTSNLSGLKDITTNSWTLGPDLDPFLFLRWAKHIIANGSLFAIDSMRNVPLGFDTRVELILHPYLIAWFHKIAVLFGSTSVEQSAVLFPVAMFALTVVAFFFFVRKIFIDNFGELYSNLIALISCFFLSVIPVLLPRTIAGIPEKEASGFFFLFLAFYLFLSAWKSEKNVSRYSFTLLAGLSTAAMALVWGGYLFIFLTIALATFIAFLTGNIKKEHIYLYSIWFISASISMSLFSVRYPVIGILKSASTGITLFVLVVMIVDLLIFNTRVKNYFEPYNKIPRQLLSLGVSLIAVILLSSLFFGLDFIPDKFNQIIKPLTSPTTDRLGITVAENKQPFFNEWSQSFGPYFRSIPILFWLFFIGSVYLFSQLVTSFEKKERIILTISYTLFLISIIFSRYSGSSVFNGTNMQSYILFFGGIGLFLFTFGKYYYVAVKKQNKSLAMGYEFIFLLSFFFLSIVAARGAVRLIMMLVPAASILSSYLLISLIKDVRNNKNENKKLLGWAAIAIVSISLVFSGYQFYLVSEATAKGYVPNIYTQQWQLAMEWVRDNTAEDAVFGHWWDYGYWVQSIGERATVLDGGNALPYWNYLMGRHALTGSDNIASLEYLYSHKTTHFLIDSSDIGKYGAFSSIGSDKNYDRYSYITTFIRDDQQTIETKNSTIYIYKGGFPYDEDLIYNNNGTKIFLPAGKGGLGAVLIEKDPSGKIIKQPRGIFVDQKGTQYDLPLRYMYDDKLIDFGSGIDGGIFLMSSVNGNSIEEDGALLYLSNRTVKSQLARLYLYKEDNPYFKLVHTQDDFFVNQIKSQNPSFTDDFVYYQGFRGPIRIWEIRYPEGMQVKEEYLQTDYPSSVSR